MPKWLFVLAGDLRRGRAKKTSYRAAFHKKRPVLVCTIPVPVPGPLLKVNNLGVLRQILENCSYFMIDSFAG